MLVISETAAPARRARGTAMQELVPSLRLSFCLNAGPKQGAVLAAAVVKAERAALVQVATNKLKLKKKQAAGMRLFLWKAGTELPHDRPLAGLLQNDDVIAVSLGEAYAGATRSPLPSEALAAAADAAGAAPSSAADAWDLLSPGKLAVVRWRDAVVMNRSLCRMSTLLEHPTFCAAVSGAVVDLETQRGLPSSAYLGHNLYAETFASFERLVGTASDDELHFLRRWREHGKAEVVISFVAGARDTLAHELCHACYALAAAYRAAADAAWAEWRGALTKWMADLGYHASRHADEFAAYVLTEPPTFWRGRLSPQDLRSLRCTLAVERSGAAMSLGRCEPSDPVDHCEEVRELL